MICEVTDSETANCFDYQPSNGRATPDIDTEGESILEVKVVTVAGDWTTVTFEKPTVPQDDDEDYDLAQVFRSSQAVHSSGILKPGRIVS